MKKRNSDNRTAKVTLPEDLYVAIKNQAKVELRSLSQQLRYFVKLGVDAYNQMQQCSSEEGVAKEELPEQIGFKVDVSEEVEEDEFEDKKKKRK